MADFAEAIAAQLAGNTVRVSPLVEFRFASGTVRLWPGFGPLVTTDGQSWTGIGNLGRLSILEAGPGQAASERTYSLFGDETTLTNIAADADEAAEREVFDYLQFFDVREEDGDGNWVDWALLGAPWQSWWGVMGELTVDRPAMPPGERMTRTITITAQNAFTNRRRPANSFYTDRDQKARSSGDNIFVAMGSVDRRVNWPFFS